MHLSFRLLIIFAIMVNVLSAQNNAEMFEPPVKPQEFWAKKATSPINIDGELKEPDWEQAQLIEGMVQKDPNQGQPASYVTSIKVLYNEQYLYVAAICYQPKSTIRVQNLRRDFDYDFNDLFGIAIDGYQDKRNASVFQVSPYGNIRDLQALDGTIYNREWDALWQARTQRMEDRWTLEMAIPWKVLRYAENCTSLGVIFTRNIRSNNELASLPGIPRVFDVYRMAYEGVLQGIQAPPPSSNLQINPYFLANGDHEKQGNDNRPFNLSSKVGGEVKWAINPSTVLDATINTDFAQADVDRQVVNFERYSVFFPERRQFFLESANVFNASVTNWIRPFFSRRIGLDQAGNPIPIDGGLRLVGQDAKKQYGALAIRQRATSTAAASNFGVMRYSQNLSQQNRLGGMATWRQDEALENNGINLPANHNYTATIDGLFQPVQSFAIKGMFSSSFDQAKGNGFAGQFFTYYENNWIYIGLLEYFNKDYHPGVGLEILDDNYLMTSPAIVLDWRPKWLPKQVRRLRPYLDAYIFNSTDDGRSLFGNMGISPIGIELQNSAEIRYALAPNWQNLDASFFPLGLEIEKGQYQYLRHQIEVNTDLSAPIGASASAELGRYFDGQLNTYTLTGRYAPIPHIEFQVDYEWNQYRSIGINNSNGNTNLLGINTRLALHPRLQLIGFYQWNDSVNRSIWNIRFSWEYRPLSFIYLVFNSNRLGSDLPENQMLQQQYLGKITFLKQL